MTTASIDMTAVRLVEVINANLQEMGSVVVLTTSASASQMVSALNAEFNGIDGAVELSTSMTAAAFVEAVNTNFSLAEGGIIVKEKFRAELADTVAKANALDTEDNLVFLLVTDIHYNCTSGDDVAVPTSQKVFDETAKNMKALMEEVGVDEVVCLGDMIEGKPNSDGEAETISDASTIMGNFDSMSSPCMIVLGNHDDNKNGYSNTTGKTYTQFTRAQMKSLFLYGHTDTTDVTFQNTDYMSDYYKDFDEYGLRVIVIYGNGASSNNYSFNSDTRVFLYNSIDSMPEGYKAIVFTHVPPCSKMNYNNRTRDGGESGNTVIGSTTITGGVVGVINQFPGKVIATLYGHCHQDNVWADPFVCIGTCCNKSVAVNGSPSYWSEDAVMPSRSASSHTQDLWDVVLVKPTAKVIEMVRFGAGADRTIHYEPIECAAGLSVTLASKISGGTWGLRTSDQSKASVVNGVVTVNDDIVIDPDHDTLLSVWCKSSDWAVNSSRQLTAGSSIEYWTIKVINT